MAQVATIQQAAEVPVVMGFGTAAGFALMQRAATLLAASALVPKEYQGNIANATIALEMAARIGASPLAVMQNLYIVHGKPSWSSQFIIAAVNGTGKFSPIRFQVEGDGDDKTCIAWATERETGERLESPPISIGMAKKEGWFGKNGSKWQTMPELMLRYRAATLFGRLYAPEILMGMKAYEEIIDIEGEAIPERSTEKIIIPTADQSAMAQGFAEREAKIKSFDDSIPPDINKDLLDEFLTRTAEANKSTIEAVKVSAADKPSEFWKVFYAYQKQKLNSAKQTKNKNLSLSMRLIHSLTQFGRPRRARIIQR